MIRTIAIVPAHNEEESVAQSIRSLHAQTESLSGIYVIADNCTDRTRAAAEAEPGVTVIETEGNAHHKAGALNQALAALLPDLDDADFVLLTDADIDVAPEFLHNAMEHFVDKPQLGVVSGNLAVRPYRGLFQLMQAMEYERERRAIGRKQGKAGCAAGTSLFRVGALREIARRHGTVYDPTSWTEDWTLTFALKRAGYQTLRPQDCVATTGPVSSWRMLFRQRQRWGHGYIQSLTRSGVTRCTLGPWASQLYWGLSLGVWVPWLVLMAYVFAKGGAFHVSAFLVALTVIFTSARVTAVHKMEARAVLVAGLIVPEMVYSWFVTLATASGIIKHFTGSHGQFQALR